ncbi:MAG: hypothetical protein ABI650_04075 [Dokdonella sp.]
MTDAAAEVASVAFALGFVESSGASSLAVGVARQTVDQRVPVLAAPTVDLGAELPRFGLQRTIVAPSYVRQWGNSGAIGITAVLAYQRFATLGFGEVSLRDDAMFWPTMAGESSYGGGMRVDADNAFGDRLRWSAAYQSRVNMDALNSYRGVYSDPGQFDLPASLSVGLSYALTRALTFDVGMQRVMYSEVTPFTSIALPRRFLALLGTGASPEFAWQDLDVYSAGWILRNATLGSLELRYTTRQQPSPTSALLRTALDANPQDHTVALGYSRATGRNANISMQAVYSSAPYFLGVPSYRARTDSKGSSVEFEALWALRF